MKGKDFQSELIDYLYGELSDQERHDFEKKMEQNPDLKKEYEELSQVRNELSGLGTIDRAEPTHFNLPPYRTVSSHSTFLRSVLAVAASLALIMMVGFATKFQLSVSKEGVQLGFNPAKEVEKALTEDDIRNILKDELIKSNNELLTSAAITNEVTDNRIVSLEKSLKKISANNAKTVVTKDDLARFLIMAEERNTEAMRQFMTTFSVQQQQYFKTTFTQYNEYVQAQRQEDLTLIRSEFIEMKQNQTIQKNQTDQVLASLISTVNTK